MLFNQQIILHVMEINDKQFSDSNKIPIQIIDQEKRNSNMKKYGKILTIKQKY